MSESEIVSNEPQTEGYLKEKAKRIERQSRLVDIYGGFLPRLKGGLLEIGCGHGHWLTAWAEQHPDQFCIGIDLLGKRIQKSGSKAGKRELQNVCFMKAEAIEFLELIPDDIGIAQVMVLFPDPWPKKRHHRRRLIQPAFLELLSRKMQNEGKLYFRTDHGPYFDWAVEAISESPHWNLDAEQNWPMELPTYFQRLMNSYQSLSAIVVKSTVIPIVSNSDK